MNSTKPNRLSTTEPSAGESSRITAMVVCCMPTMGFVLPDFAGSSISSASVYSMAYEAARRSVALADFRRATAVSLN